MSGLIVVDRLTLFKGLALRADEPAFVLLASFAGFGRGRASFLGATTPAEIALARRYLDTHHEKRAEKFDDAAYASALSWLEQLLESTDFEVRRHPSVDLDHGGDPLSLLSAATHWGASYMCSYDTDLLRLASYRHVKIRRPEAVIAELTGERVQEPGS